MPPKTDSRQNETRQASRNGNARNDRQTGCREATHVFLRMGTKDCEGARLTVPQILQVAACEVIESRRMLAAVHESGCGTNRTNRAGLEMSVPSCRTRRGDGFGCCVDGRAAQGSNIQVTLVRSNQ
jgi:hypothetical protein